MILGLGSDVVNITRIERVLSQFGKRFITRTFTLEEITGAEKYTNPRSQAAYYARRFAAKEACAKALGTGFRHGLRFTDIGVVHAADGKPELVLRGKAAVLAAEMSRDHVLHLTLSDDYPTAMAVVIISR